MSNISPQQVVAAVRSLTPGASLEPETPILSTGIIDSLSMMELTDALSKAFSVDLDVAELGFDNADTPAQIAQLINTKLS